MEEYTTPDTGATAKEERINDEYNRLLKIFDKLDRNKLLTVIPLIQNAAFMRVTLEDIQRDINLNGIDQIYQHGEKQTGTKATPAISAYNAMMRNFISVIKELVKIAPADVHESRLLKMMFGETQPTETATTN